ncbi:MAG: DUF2723 domain-containing protein, partial [Chloroflexi bacterium]|nr:DUF2723 domain-containing protein [Chloroflexota bacterium]
MLASHSPTHPPAPVTVHPVRSARWSLLAQALVVGLYLGRVVAETAVQPWPLAWLLPLVAGGLVAGLAVSLLAERYLATGLPLLLLGAYVLWPVASATWAIGILAAALIVLLMANARALPTPWPEALAVGGGLLLYGSTVSPGLLPADSGEFQLVATVLGIAHPPGYPLYTMVGRLATLLVPLGDPALRLNLLSVLLSALTLGVVAHTVRRRTGSAAAALVAAGALGFSATFWAQATTANIRALTGLFVALLVALALRWGEERSPRLLWILAGVFGLAVGHHSSLAPLGLPLAGYVLWREPTLLRRPRRWVAPLAALAASFAVLLYLPVRSLWGAPFDPEPIRSLADMAQHVLALGFRGDMFYFRTLPALAARTAVWAQIMRLEFGLPLLVAAGLAAVAVARRDRRAALLVGGILGVNTVLAVTYRAPQTVEYLLPSYVALAVLLGEGLGLAVAALGDHAHGWGRWGAGILVAVLAVAAVGNGWANWPSFRTLHRDDATRQAAESLLRDAPPGALVLANWHHATPLWYLQEVDGLREDVEVVYVYPEGATPNEEVWLRRIDEALDERPVIVTNRFYAYEGADLRFVPYHDAWL